MRQIAREQFLRPLHAIARDPLLPHAKQLGILRREKKMRHELERLALVPQALRRLGDRRLKQSRHDIVLLGRHRAGGGNNRALFLRENRGAQLRVEVRFAIGQLLLQMLARKFQGDELMMVAAPGARPGSGSSVRRSNRRCPEHNPLASAVADRAPAFHVQAELDAARMKAQAPIERPLRPEIVPFDADPEAVEIAIELPPTLRDRAPGAALRRRFIDGNHRANLTGVAAANASQV